MYVHSIAKDDTLKQTKTQLKRLCKAVQEATQHKFNFAVTTSQNALASAYGFTSWSDLTRQAKHNTNDDVFSFFDDVSSDALHQVFSAEFIHVAEQERRAIVEKSKSEPESKDLDDFTLLWQSQNNGSLTVNDKGGMPSMCIIGKPKGSCYDVGDAFVVFHRNTRYVYTVESVSKDTLSLIAGLHVMSDNGTFSIGGFETKMKGERLLVLIEAKNEALSEEDRDVLGEYVVRVDADVKPRDRAAAALDCIANTIPIECLDDVSMQVYDGRGDALNETRSNASYLFTGRAVLE